MHGQKAKRLFWEWKNKNKINGTESKKRRNKIEMNCRAKVQLRIRIVPCRKWGRRSKQRENQGSDGGGRGGIRKIVNG